ncbi:MAG: pirin family protein [Vicinamibacterales bacterium]|nr:pirin family protein [Vicinamibacterales bacterium]
MSFQPAAEPGTDERPDPALDLVIVPRVRDLGGFEVRRVLPSGRRKMVGPFIFLDQMGPALFEAGLGLDVRPHPHIGLATVTYLFSGELLHRDSVGSVQAIRAGEVNWMTAGRGIAHSERTSPAARAAGGELFGIQMWVALPQADEEMPPGFAHHAPAELPVIEAEGARVTLVAGAWHGARSPVETRWETLLADAVLAPGARLPLPPSHEERAVFVASGMIDVAGQVFEAGPLVVLKPGVSVTLAARTAARVVVLGGAPMDGPRHIWWNFVSSSRERIEQAKADWVAGRFDLVPDEAERIPLPER